MRYDENRTRQRQRSTLTAEPCLAAPVSFYGTPRFEANKRAHRPNFEGPRIWGPYLHRRHLTTTRRAIAAGTIADWKLGDNQYTEGPSIEGPKKPKKNLFHWRPRVKWGFGLRRLSEIAKSHCHALALSQDSARPQHPSKASYP